MKTEYIHSNEQVIFITNDTSMMPQLMPGSMLSGHYIETYLWGKQTNGVYAILLDGGIVLIRRVKDNELDTKGILTLYSDYSKKNTEVVTADQIHSMYMIDEILKQVVY
jgi:repressor LexA